MSAAGDGAMPSRNAQGAEREQETGIADAPPWKGWWLCLGSGQEARGGQDR